MPLNTLTVQNVLIAYMCLWATAPPLAYGGAFRALVLLAAMGWLIVECFRPTNIIKKPTLPAILAGVYILYVGLVEYLFGGTSAVLRNIQIFIALLFLVIYQSRRHDLRSLLPVFWIMLVTMPIWQIITIDVIWSENSRVARILVRSTSEAAALSARGIGGYGLVYGTLLMMPALIGLGTRPAQISKQGLPKIIRSISVVPKLIVWTNIVTGTLLIVNAGFSIAALSLIVCVAAVFSLRTYSAPRMLIILALGGFLSLFSELLITSALTALLPSTEGTNFYLKINDVLQSYQVEETVGTLSDRIERYERSFGLFLENPLLGTLSFDNIGKHSHFLDDFAQFGILVGAVSLYVFLFASTRMMLQAKREFGVAFGTLVATLMLLCLNNGFAGVGVALFIVFPVANHLLEMQKRKQLW